MPPWAKMNSRAQAANVLYAVLASGKNLEYGLAKIKQDKAFVQELCFGVCRYYHQLDAIAKRHLKKPFAKKDFDIYALLLVGIYQLLYLDTEDFAALNETVEASKQLKKKWASGLLNAVLRNILRNKDAITSSLKDNPVSHFSHPEWLINKLKKAWPKHWQAILEANNQRAAMTLRVNQQKGSRDDYLARLKDNNIQATASQLSENGITLEKAIDVYKLPNFEEGAVSVQDEAAQLAAEILAPQPGDVILDACAAPGGKTCHLLEIQPDITLTAIDNDEQRLTRVKENLDRLQLNANIITGDACQPASWARGMTFDKILLDAPCSATGVIRRHPDIKLLRRETDIKQLKKTQLTMLCALWPLLKKGGCLLYTTCSVLPEENDQVIKRFLDQTPSTRATPLGAGWGIVTCYGKQLLPSPTDGFYFCLLVK